VSGSDGPVPGGRNGTPRWGLAVVSGDSMRPTYRPGDRLLVGYRRRPAPGDVVVVRAPGRPVSVKRAVERRRTALEEDGWWLLSDDPGRGTDSRTYGAVADEDVLAVVIMRIWPLAWRRAVPDSTGA
jgi:phage repressor protein C with HTH and peptisase S24 domain